jgi:acid phosphatase
MAPPASPEVVPAPPPATVAAPAVPPAAQDSDDTTAFVFLGDTGKGSPGQKRVADAVKAWCADHRCDFVALLGDVLYPSGAQTVDDPVFAARFESYWEGFDGPFMVAFGNHDHYGKIEAELAYARTSTKWVQPAAWYRFERGPATFYVLDTGDGTKGALPAEQAAWLRAELAKPATPWRVAYGHHPMHSSGLHGGGEALTTALDGLLAAAGVQFWLCGHEHNLEVIDDGGLPVEIISGAGAEARRVAKPVAGSRYLASSLGFGYLTLDSSRASLEMVEVGAGGATVAWTGQWTVAKAAGK